MAMQDRSKERKDRMRGTARPQTDPMAAGSGRARDRAQDMADPMRRPETDREGTRRDGMRPGGAPEPMRRGHPEPGPERPAEEMPGDGIG